MLECLDERVGSVPGSGIREMSAKGLTMKRLMQRSAILSVVMVAAGAGAVSGDNSVVDGALHQRPIQDDSKW